MIYKVENIRDNKFKHNLLSLFTFLFVYSIFSDQIALIRYSPFAELFFFVFILVIHPYYFLFFGK